MEEIFPMNQIIKTLIFFLIIASCSDKIPDSKKIKITLPSKKDLQTRLGRGFGFGDPANNSEVDCIGLFATYPEIPSSNFCLGFSSGLEETRPNVLLGMFGLSGAAAEVEIEVPLGENRKFELLGFARDEVGLTICPSFFDSNFSTFQPYLSHPSILGSAVVDIGIGSDSLNLAGEVSTSIKLGDCNGPLFGDIEGTPSFTFSPSVFNTDSSANVDITINVAGIDGNEVKLYQDASCIEEFGGTAGISGGSALVSGIFVTADNPFLISYKYGPPGSLGSCQASPLTITNDPPIFPTFLSAFATGSDINITWTESYFDVDESLGINAETFSDIGCAMPSGAGSSSYSVGSAMIAGLTAGTYYVMVTFTDRSGHFIVSSCEGPLLIP